MYAIVEIAGQQFKVAKDQQIYVHRLEEKEGANIKFDNILLVENDGKITVGAPAVTGASVSARVLEHLKGDKVIVFKKKRRKGYRKKNGHRQYLTKLEISAISLSGSSTKKESKPAEKEEKVAKPAAKAEAPSTKTANDDLTQITGIGPVHAKSLNDAGYTSFEQLASLTAKDIEKIAEIDGISTDKIEADDWKNQAAQLNNFNKLIANLGSAKASDKDDLTQINGIGPATEKDLNEKGIYTYGQISKIHVKDMEYLSAISGITREKIESEEWVKQAKALLKK